MPDTLALPFIFLTLAVVGFYSYGFFDLFGGSKLIALPPGLGL